MSAFSRARSPKRARRSTTHAARRAFVAPSAAMPPPSDEYERKEQQQRAQAWYAIVGFGLMMLVGFTGQISLGHAAFFGIGAYTSTILLIRVGLSPWLGLLAGAGRPARAAATRSAC